MIKATHNIHNPIQSHLVHISLIANKCSTRSVMSIETSVSDRFGQRHVQVSLMFFLLFLSNALRINMSLGIVAMTDSETTNAEVTIN